MKFAWFKKTEVRYALIAVVCSLVFGLITSALPENISQKDPMYGYGSDSDIYWDIAGNIVDHKGFVNSPGFYFATFLQTDQYTPSTIRLPGYPFALASMRFLTGTDNPAGLAMKVFNLALVFVNALLIILLFEKHILKRPIENPAWYWIIALFPPFLIYSNGVNSDLFTGVLVLVFSYFFFSQNKLFILAPLSAALAVFTRSITLIFFIVFLILAFLHAEGKKEFLKKAATCFAFVLIVYISWSYRNYRLSGTFTYLPFTGPPLQQNYFRKIERMNVVESTGFRWNSVDYRMARYKELVQEYGLYQAEVKINKEIERDTWNFLFNHKIIWVKVYVRNVAQMFVNEYFVFQSWRQIHLFSVAAVGAIALFTGYILPAIVLLGSGLHFLLQLFKGKGSAISVLVVAGLGYIFGTALILGDFARYLLPVNFVMVLSLLYSVQIIKVKISPL